QNIGIERPREAAFTGQNNNKNFFFRAMREKRMLGLIDARHDRSQDACEFQGVRPRSQCCLLRAAQAGRGDELHGTSNLLSVLHRADAAPKIEKCRHGRSLGGRPQFRAVAATAAVKRSLKPSIAFLISALMPSSKAFFSEMLFRMEGLLVSTNCKNSFSKRRTSGTGML